MRLLVDTHTLIWFLSSNGRLGRRARELLYDDSIVVFVSAVSVWELGIKFAAGRLAPLDDVRADIDTSLAVGVFERLDITIDHARSAAALPLLHSDPFDRMLVAQALAEGLTLLTNDAAIARYDVETLW